MTKKQMRRGLTKLGIRRGAGVHPQPAGAAALSFRRRYADLEAAREALIARLASVNGASDSHPARARALALLNSTFRKASLSQRVAILDSAEWLIRLLEQIAMMV